MEKPEVKRPMGRPRRRWEGNIKMDLQSVGCGSMDWIDLAQDRDRWRALVTAVMSIRVPYHHHRMSVTQLGHLLTRSGLTYPEISSKVYHDSSRQFGSSVSLPSVWE